MTKPNTKLQPPEFYAVFGLTLADEVPDSKTIWHFRERIAELGLAEILFKTFIRITPKQMRKAN